MSFTRKDYQEEAPRKILTPAEAKIKIASYCAYQERCQKEVRDKLYEYGLHSHEVENLITSVILEGFLNEERFAKAFARGKFRIKKWGRSEEHTSELQSRENLVCRLLLEKKKNYNS